MLWTSRFGGRRAIIAFTGWRSASEKARDLQLVRNLALAGKLRGAACRRFPFEQTADAHRLREVGRKQGNVVITCDHRFEA
jgi:NADPH:quinone reductase-like Zn-dependent oxidoreductase